MFELSEQYYTAGRTEEAFKMIQQAAKIDPENKWYQMRLGQFYRNLEQYDDFIQLYEKLTAQYPDDPDMLGDLTDAAIFIVTLLAELIRGETAEGLQLCADLGFE